MLVLKSKRKILAWLSSRLEECLWTSLEMVLQVITTSLLPKIVPFTTAEPLYRQTIWRIILDIKVQFIKSDAIPTGTTLIVQSFWVAHTIGLLESGIMRTSIQNLLVISFQVKIIFKRKSMTSVGLLILRLFLEVLQMMVVLKFGTWNVILFNHNLRILTKLRKSMLTILLEL